MNDVVQMEKEQYVEKVFKGFLDRYFSVACRPDKGGNLVCHLVAKNVIQKPGRERRVVVRVSKEHLDNYGYMNALVESGTRELVGSALRL